MGVNATYSFFMDFARDQFFAHALSNLSSRVISMEWSAGQSEPYGEFAPPARATVVLSNHDNMLMPDKTSSPYYGLFTKDTYCYIGWTWYFFGNPVMRQAWSGKLKKTQIGTQRMANPNSATVTLSFEDFTMDLQQQEFFPTLQTNVRTGDAIAAAITEAGITAPRNDGYFAILDASNLDTDTYLHEQYTVASTGDTTLNYVGDNSDTGKGVNLQGYLRDIVAAELGGRFNGNPNTGVAPYSFTKRYRDLLYYIGNGGTDYTLNSNFIESVDYRYGDDVVNDVTVNFQPREIGIAGTILGNIDKPIQLSPLSGRTFSLRYRDPDSRDARIGALSQDDLVSGVDYIANAASDGSGGDMTSFLGVSASHKAQSTEFQLYNTSATTAMYVTTLQVRGTPLYTYSSMSVNEVDAESIEAYNRQRKSYSIKLIDDEDIARDYARLQVNRFKDPFGRFQSVTVVLNDDYDLMSFGYETAGGTGYLVTVNDLNYTGMQRDYVIVGYRTNFDAASLIHRMTWILKPLARERYCILDRVGFAELDSTAYLAL